MRIQFFSDLHLEFLKSSCPNIKSTAPVLCLLGDIGNPFHTNYARFLCHLNPNPDFKKIFLISGNHEYYSKDKTKSIMQTNLQIQSIIYGNCLNKISYLDNQTEYYNNYLFVGSTLWSNIINSQNLHSDFHYIKGMDIGRYNQLHTNATKFILANINNSNSKIIVLTHHLPSYSIIHEKYKNYLKYHQCFASHCDSLIKPPVSLWLYGHTHTPKNDRINNIPVICNPIGYPREKQVCNFEQFVEV
jgi:predicted phosphodiesterase